MEKLIMLLDIYEEEVVGVHSVWEKITDKEEARIISKKFWFIEWLVQNLKINVDELRKHWYITKTYDLDEPWEWCSYLDWLLMLLSIQDEPIEFLISILK